MINEELFSGLPPVIYLTLNKTIRNETRKLLLKLLCLTTEQITRQTRQTRFYNAARIQNNNGDESIEPSARRQQKNIHSNSNQIVPMSII